MTEHMLRMTRNASRELSNDGVKQIIMGYRGKRLAVVDPDWTPKPGMLYTQVRAISARINQNFDAWPSEELKKSFRTFIGKPVFVNHANEDPEKARGKVIAARYIESGDDKYVEVIQEVDGTRFPKLAREIREGGLDSVSMGVEAGITKCSYCGNTATDEPEFCDHVRHHKGEYLTRKNQRTGHNEDVLVYENCYKLGFFELSYVFDPADETAVVSRVISAARSPRRRTAYGEVEAPEDIDTLRDEKGETFEDYQFVEPISDGKDENGDEDKDDNPFQHWLSSPEELQAPDLGATKRLDREQEDDGLDSDRRVEDVEGVLPEDEAAMAQQQGRQAMASNRTRRRRYAGDDAALIDQAVQELEQYEAEMGGGDDMGDDMGDDPYAEEDEGDYAEEGYSDEEPDDDGDGYPEDEDGYDDDGDGMDEEMEPGADEQYMGDSGGGEMEPRYDDEMMGDPRMARRRRADSYTNTNLEGGGPDGWTGTPEGAGSNPGTGGILRPIIDSDISPGTLNTTSAPLQMQGGKYRAEAKRRYEASCRQRGVRPTNEGYRRFVATVGQAASTGNRRGKGKPMGSLSGRGRVAARGRNRHFADTSGYTDGGPYGNDSDQGEQEEVYISQVPPAEAVEFPVRGDDTISNTDQNLVARRKRIKSKAADLQRDLRAYRRLASDADECCDDNIIEPDVVNPGTDYDEYKGDFESVQPDAVPTQPKDASLHVFRSFDNWLRNTTGRTSAQHGNANFIRRQAASYAKAAGVPLDRMFPTLDVVLRRARKTEMDRRAAMKRRADESLDVAAPQERIDVEAPVQNVTDERAQSSQSDLGDYGNNAGDSIADPNLETNSQIWAPGEGENGTKNANRKADGVAAVRYAEAVINAGLPFRDKWQLVAQAQTMRHATVVDRTRVLEAVVESNTKRSRSRKVAAAVSRGTTGNGFPRGMTAPRTAATQRTAANDPVNDIGIWL